MRRSSVGSSPICINATSRSLSLINANSAADLKMRSLKVGVADEIDTWPDSLGDDGDPFDLFRGRFISFHATGDWRIFALSTPKVEQSSRIDKLFKDAIAAHGDGRFSRANRNLNRIYAAIR